MRLGLDFGTTNSAVAFFDGDELHTLKTDPANSNPYVTPSLIYVDRHGTIQVGARAAESYLEAEMGRFVRWQRKDAGDLEMTVASFDNEPIEFVQTVNVLVDVAANGRLLQSIKTALFNDRYEGTQIFGRFFPVDELIHIVLSYLRNSAETQLGKTCDRIMLGRPVRFSPNPLADSRAEAILMRAAHLAGFKDIRFELEPVGIAHLYHRSSRQRQTILIFDFGGGTLDLTIARVGGSITPEILAIEGVRVGGDDLDRRIMEWLLPHFGGGDHHSLPPEMADKLLTWQTMPELSQPHNLERIHELQRSNGHVEQLHALETLVTRNLGFKLFQEIERVKQILSSHHAATLVFQYENININQPITRRRFERLIDTELSLVREGVESVMHQAQIKPDAIDAVLRTGGSSLVPAFAQLLTNIFGEDRQREIDPMVSVVGGFAVSGYELERAGIQPFPDANTLYTSVRVASRKKVVPYHIGLHQRCYSDRGYIVYRLPYPLSGLPAIRLPNQDYNRSDVTYLTLMLSHPIKLYVAYEASVPQVPYWLRAFDSEPFQLEVREEFALISRSMRVYGKEFSPGEVKLGAAQAAGCNGEPIVNYLVILEPLK